MKYTTLIIKASVNYLLTHFKSTQSAPKHNFNRQYNVLFIGDSLVEKGNETPTKGYLSQLRNAYVGRAAFYDVGISGATTDQFMDIMLHSKAHELYPENIDKVFFGFGTNDVSSLWDPNYGPDAEHYGQFLNRLYDKITTDICKDFVFVFPPEINNGDKRRADGLVIFREIMNKFIAEKQIKSIDIRQKIKPGEIYQQDGVHYNDVGNTYMYELFQQQIGQLSDWNRKLYDGSNKWHFCDNKDFSLHLEENQETGECECQQNYYKVINQENPSKLVCELCPDKLSHTVDFLKCQCKQQFQDFDLAAKKCVCIKNTKEDQNSICVPAVTQQDLISLQSEKNRIITNQQNQIEQLNIQIQNLKNEKNLQNQTTPESKSSAINIAIFIVLSLIIMILCAVLSVYALIQRKKQENQTNPENQETVQLTE